MPIYAYHGVDDGGQRAKGTIAADSPRAGRDRLRDRGVRVESLSLIETDHSTSWWRSLRLYRARQQWAGAAHELSMLLRAGISVDEAIDTLSGQYRGAFRDSLKQLYDQVSAGQSLAHAMSQQAMVFDAASIRLVEVGENAGNLDIVLDELADFKRRMSEFGDKVFGALMYPIFLMLFGTAATVFLMTWVLPPLLENLQETLQVIPWPTRVAKVLSDFLVAHGFKLILTLAVSVVAVFWWTRLPRGRRWVDGSLLRLPVIGPLLVKQSVARASMVIGMLLRSGIPLSQALELAARSTQNRIIRDCLQLCAEDLTAGRDVAGSLSRGDVFPPLAVRVFSVGQDSGQLDEMLIRLGQDYNQQVQVAATRLTTLLEPALILVMALLVGFLLVATILPILQAGQTI